MAKHTTNSSNKKVVEKQETVPAETKNGSLISCNKNNKSFWIFVAVAVFILGMMLFLSKDAGMSGDEGYHLKHAKDVLNFYKTFGKDTVAVTVTAASSAENSREYGQVPDNIAEFIASVLNIEDILSVRHVVNSIFGWIGILFASLLAYRISKKWYAAIVTAILLFLSPRYLGHSFNNLKDIPFAAMMMMGTYYIFRFLQTVPKPPIRVLVMLAVSIGMAIGTRVGGLLLIAYFVLFVISYLVYQWFNIQQEKKNQKKNFKNKTTTSVTSQSFSKLVSRMFVYGVLVSLAGYFIAVLLWPYAMVSPIENVYTAFTKMSHFEISLRQIFEGKTYWSNALPWYYTAKYIIITIPIAVIIGMLMYPFVGGCKKQQRFNTFFVYFAFIFPIFWIAFTNANVYGGWRHSLFAYPPIVVAAGLGFCALVELLKNKSLKIAAAILPFALLIPQVVHIAKNHPYEYVYFNEIEGGMKKAYGKYELDYYFHGLRKATEWTVAEIKKNKTGVEKTKLAGWILPAVHYYSRFDTADIQIVFTRYYERGNTDWDYAIFPNSGVFPERLRNNTYPPDNTIHTITVDNYPIAIILKRTDKSDYYGYKLMEEGKIDSAKVLFKKALQASPQNESVLTNMANIYLQQGQLDSAEMYLNQFLAFDPNHENEKYMLAMVCYYKKDFNRALAICKEMTNYNKKFSSAYSLAANIYLQSNDIYSAEKELMKLMDVGAFDQNAFNQLMSIYNAQGLDSRTAQKKIFKELVKSYKKQGNKELAKQFQEQADSL